MKIEEKCRDFGQRPGCLGDVDPEYTMDYTDVEDGGYIYWCAFCGPVAHEMDTLLNKVIAERGPEFQKALDAAITAAEEKKRLTQS